MKYKGSCHCGAVKFDVEMEIKDVMECNCSICSRKGHLLAFAPEAKMDLMTPQSAIGEYLFGPKKIHHCFCKTCGVATFGRAVAPDGTPTVAINARCLENLDLSKIPVVHVDGKSF